MQRLATRGSRKSTGSPPLCCRQGLLRQMARLLSVAFALCAVLHGSETDASQPGAPDLGDPERGAAALRLYGCGACHRIPGIPGAHGNVGPPLTRMAKRVYLAGVLPNTPANLIRWIQGPQHIAPMTAMPDLQVKQPDARDIAAYLYRD